MTYLMGEEKPSLEDVLEHHGVKGMKWGVRRDPVARVADQKAKQDLNSVRLHNRSAVRELEKKSVIKNPTNTQIRTAREQQPKHEANVSKARSKYKTSKAQYRVNKEEVGRTRARIILEKQGKLPLQKAKARRDANYNTASRETSEEAVNRMIKNILGVY